MREFAITDPDGHIITFAERVSVPLMLLALLMLAQVARGRDPGHLPRAGRFPTTRLDPRARCTARRNCCRVVFRSRAPRPAARRAPVAGQHHPHHRTPRSASSAKSANGGRSVEWRITNGPSTLDLYVNHGLEVNVERDLDPAVDLDEHRRPDRGRLCTRSGSGIRRPRQPTSREPSIRLEWNAAIGVARSVNLFQSTAGRSYAVQTIGWGRELTRGVGAGIAARPLRVGG